VQGDLDDRASLERARRGGYGVFSVQNFWLPGVGFDGEVRQGRALADAAAAAGVRHFVCSSVGGAERNTGIAHFESKWLIGQHVRTLCLPATVLRPAYFMENLRRPGRGPKDGVPAMELKPTTALQMIAVDDFLTKFGKAFQYNNVRCGSSLRRPDIADPQAGLPLQALESFPRKCEVAPCVQMHAIPAPVLPEDSLADRPGVDEYDAVLGRQMFDDGVAPRDVAVDTGLQWRLERLQNRERREICCDNSRCSLGERPV
jgi:hypothetical protein